jgi:hypothetical protein
MQWDTVQQFIRILLQFAAGWLVQKGYINADMAVTFTGAMLSLAGIAWWAIWNRTRPAIK